MTNPREILSDYSFRKTSYEDAVRVIRVAVDIDMILSDYSVNSHYKLKLESARDAIIEHANKLATFCK